MDGLAESIGLGRGKALTFVGLVVEEFASILLTFSGKTFPAGNFVEDSLHTGGERFGSGVGLAGVDGAKSREELGNIEEIFRDGAGFDTSEPEGRAGGEVRGV